MIDTHAHLDACAEPADTLIERAASVGVTRIVTIGSGIDSSRDALATANRHTGVYAAVGIHPHEAGGRDADRLDELPTLIRNPRTVAIGETGLDFFRDYAPRSEQRRLFAAHLELAATAGKAVVIHCRDAEDAVATELQTFPGTIVLHCFSAPSLLPFALEKRCYVSFAGNVTYPRADDLRAAAADVPDDRILAETDSPYLSPQPIRGRPNEPANVVHTVAALADARGTTAERLAQLIDANADAAFELAAER